MMTIYERMTDQIVRDRHQSLAELYHRSQRPGVVSVGLGSFLVRVGRWLRHDVELPAMAATRRPKLRPGEC
jgi:hypothetical protein